MTSLTKVPAWPGSAYRLLLALPLLVWALFSSAARVRNSLRKAVEASTDRLTRGNDLRVAVLLKQARKVDPQITEDELSASRLIMSEGGSQSPEVRACFVDAEVNRARRKNISLTEHLTGGTGVYGRQRKPRPASTRQHSRVRDLAVARVVLHGAAKGIAKGAERFFDAKVQNGTHRRYRRIMALPEIARPKDFIHATCSAEGTLTAWYYSLPKCGKKGRCCANGLPPKNAKHGSNPERWVGPIRGVDPYRLMLMRPSEYGPAHDRSFADALTIVRGGSISLTDSGKSSGLGFLFLLAFAGVTARMA